MRTSTEAVAPPTKRGTWARLRTPLAVVGVLFVALIAVSFLTSPGQDDVTMSPRNPGPKGAQAVARVLERHGVSVIYAKTAPEAVERAASTGAPLLVAHPTRMQPDVAEAVEALPHLIYVGTEQTFTDVFPGATPAVTYASTSNEAPANCTVPEAVTAQRITTNGYALVLTDAWVGCFQHFDDPYEGDNLFGYAEATFGSKTRMVLGSSAVVQNQTILEAGNAAFALGILSRQPTLVWYVANYQDSMSDQSSVFAPVVMPLLVLLVGAGLLVGAANGRRLGRLVREDLPTPVPAIETVVGRGRALRRSRDYAHCARELRLDAARRLAKRVGVDPKAPAQELHRALVARGADEEATYQILWGPPPTSEAALLALSDQLLQLEESIAHV